MHRSTRSSAPPTRRIVATRPNATGSILAAAVCMLLVAACRPAAPGSPPPPTRAAAPTRAPDAAPDADSSYPDPDDSWFEVLEAGPIGPLLADVQAALDDGVDAERLVARIPPAAAGSPSFVVSDGVGVTATFTATAGADDVAAALRRRAEAGSTPRVQGYAAYPRIPWSGVLGPDDAMSVWVVVNGWHGDGWEDVGRARRAWKVGDAIDVWRFDREGDDWTWTEWAITADDYLTVVSAVLQAPRLSMAERDGDDDTAVYTSVRPRAWWPENDAPCVDVASSADEKWTACTGEVGHHPLGPVIGASPFATQHTYMARRLEVRSADGAVVHRVVDDWVGDDALGVPSVHVFGWLEEPTRLLFTYDAHGDGCLIFGGRYAPHVLDVATGRVTAVPIEGTELALDDAHHRMAAIDARRKSLNAIDLDTGEQWSIPWDADEAGYRQSGNVVWSPDGEAVVVTDAWDPCSDEWRERVVRFDLEAGTRTVLVPPTAGTQRVLRWGTDDVLTVEVDDPPWTEDAPRTERRNARTGKRMDPANDHGAHNTYDPTPDLRTGTARLDPWGYGLGDDGFTSLDEAEDGALLAALQAALDARDVQALTARIGSRLDGQAVRVRDAEGGAPVARWTRPEAAAMLARLLADAQPSQPAVQGVGWGTNDAPDAENSRTDRWVVVTSWPKGRPMDLAATGTQTPPAPPDAGSSTFPRGWKPAPPSTTTMVWRFTPDTASPSGWRWVEWRLGMASYDATVEQLRRDLKGKSTYGGPYAAVRRAEWWPPNDAPCVDETTSPDGAWTACNGEGEGRDIGEHWFSSQRLEVRSADGATTHRAVGRWTSSGDIGSLSVRIVGWSTEPRGLLFADHGCGDGCGAFMCGDDDLHLLTLPDGVVRDVDVEGTYYTPSPDGRQLATLSRGDVDADGDGRRDGLVLRIYTLSTMAVREVAFDGDDGDMAWSPDGRTVALAWQTQVCETDQRYAVSLVAVDSGTVTQLVPAEQGHGYLGAWSADGTLELRVNRPDGTDGEDRWEGVERRDARTGEVVGVATATRAPSATPLATATRIPTPRNLPAVSPSAWQPCCPSPDGNWSVQSVETDIVSVPDDPMGNGWYYRAQYVVSTDERVRWRVADEWSAFGLGAPSPAVLAWVPDSSAVYVMERAFGDGCDLFGSATNLDRIDVVSGMRTRIVDFLYGPQLSPDGESVVYSADNVIVRRLDGSAAVTGTLEHAQGTGWQLGDYIWSPSRRAVAFTFTDSPCVSEGIARFDLDTGTTAVLVPQTKGHRWVAEWLADDTLVLHVERDAYTATREPPVVLHIDAQTGLPRP